MTAPITDPHNVPHRGMITISIMLATIIQALDGTIANVALPHMQGSLSASQDQITWVLTSYIVAVAVMTPISGWLAAAGWIERRPHPEDRRVNRLHIKPAARKALERAMAIGDDLTATVLQDFTAAERKQLLALLGRARERLLAVASEGVKA